jgi:hypothetical protein
MSAPDASPSAHMGWKIESGQASRIHFRLEECGFRQQPRSTQRPLLLERITIHFPGTYPEFTDRLGSLLAGICRMTSHGFELTASDERFYPRLAIDFQSTRSEVAVDFHLPGAEIIPVILENTTGMERRNPLPYQPLGIEEVVRRFDASGQKIISADHVGFNLPWFGPDLHPRIRGWREKLAAGCLYHKYPTGEPWDFILPGDEEEITGRKSIDYSKIRRPKFELVSFAGASTPLIQIDVGLDERFENFSPLFPEALIDPAFRNFWIYLDSPFPVDVCLVINEHSEKDWSALFNGHRL